MPTLREKLAKSKSFFADLELEDKTKKKVVTLPLPQGKKKKIKAKKLSLRELLQKRKNTLSKIR